MSQLSKRIIIAVIRCATDILGARHEAMLAYWLLGSVFFSGLIMRLLYKLEGSFACRIFEVIVNCCLKFHAQRRDHLLEARFETLVTLAVEFE